MGKEKFIDFLDGPVGSNRSLFYQVETEGQKISKDPQLNRHKNELPGHLS